VVLPTPPDAGHKLPPPAPPTTGAALFNLLLSRAGIDPPANPGDAEKAADETGHGICSSLADGYTEQDVIDSMLAKGHFGNGAAPTPAQARVFLQAAEQAYCPRLVG
jgi:hypothetical protein